MTICRLVGKVADIATDIAMVPVAFPTWLTIAVVIEILRRQEEEDAPGL